jgi:hypothetical protein
MMNILQQALVDALELPPAAAAWLLDLWHVIQVFDDFADGDPVERSALDAAIYASLVDLPANPFYQTYAATLSPMLCAMVLKWKGSDTAEREGRADEKSFVWRAAYYDVILMVVMLCHGPKTAMHAADKVMALYGEKFEDYLKEFPNA